MEQKKLIPIFIVTKSKSMPILVGDRVYYSPDGSLVHVGFGWYTKDELTEKMLDFECKIDEMYEVCVDKHGEHIVRKGNDIAGEV